MQTENRTTKPLTDKTPNTEMLFDIPSVQIAQVLTRYSNGNDTDDEPYRREEHEIRTWMDTKGTDNQLESMVHSKTLYGNGSSPSSYRSISNCFHFTANYPVPTELTAFQLLVRVEACGLNEHDIRRRRGESTKVIELGPPTILGTDAAGVIVRMGELVDETMFDLGDRVFGRTSIVFTGTNCQYALFDVMDLAHMPDDMTFEEAACLPSGALMAWQGIHGIGCCGGQQSEITYLENSETIKNVLFGANVIIVAGDGRVVDQIVSWSILILHHMFKANVYVVCDQVEHNEPYLKQLGACQVLDYRKNFVSQLTEKVGHRAMRLALDYDGEGGNKSECHQVLTLEDGHYVSYCSNNSTSSAVSYPSSICSILGLDSLWWNVKSLVTGTSIRCHTVHPLSSAGKLLQTIVNWAEDEGDLYKRVHHVRYDLRDLVEAHMQFERDGMKSHIVITVPHTCQQEASPSEA